MTKCKMSARRGGLGELFFKESIGLRPKTGKPQAFNHANRGPIKVHGRKAEQMFNIRRYAHKCWSEGAARRKKKLFAIDNIDPPQCHRGGHYYRPSGCERHKQIILTPTFTHSKKIANFCKKLSKKFSPLKPCPPQALFGQQKCIIHSSLRKKIVS